MTKPSLRTIVRRALEGEVQLEPGSRVLVAVSGGPDSMALLDVMADLSAAFRLRLVAHGVDHGLREEANAELDRAERHADARGVPFGRSRVTVKAGGNLQERARSERYAAGVTRAHVPPPRLSLPSLATLLSRAELAVGVDTGLVHLAAALGTPTVSLFVATDPMRCGVGLAGPSARDLGGIGSVPAPEAVERAAGDVMRRAPR